MNIFQRIIISCGVLATFDGILAAKYTYNQAHWKRYRSAVNLSSDNLKSKNSYEFGFDHKQQILSDDSDTKDRSRDFGDPFSKKFEAGDFVLKKKEKYNHLHSTDDIGKRNCV